MLPITTLILLLPSLITATPILTTTEAPLHKPTGDKVQILDDHYIVVLKKGVELGVVQNHLMGIEKKVEEDPIFFTTSLTSGSEEPGLEQGGIRRVYTPTEVGGHGYYGYAGSFSASTLSHIRSSPDVAYVEHDQIITLDYLTPSEIDPPTQHTSTSTYYPSTLAPANYTPDIIHSLSSPWGLARISHRPSLTLGTLQRYDYSNHALERERAVDVYVVDTGVNVAHVELEGRAVWGKTVPSGASDFDGNGHGSHCAGTIASRKYGVAKGANIVAVKVLGDNGSGTLGDVIGGIEWAVNAAAKRQKALGKAYRGSVISMSLGGGKSQSTDDAVNAAVDAGVVVVVAAGNDNRDCDSSSPARAKKVITVGATTLGDERAYFSNYGAGININAPGLNILSIWTGGNNTANTISGTSMACPHVAGWAAYVLEIYGTETLPFMSQKQLNELTILAGETPSAADLAAEVAESEPVAQVASSDYYSIIYNALPGSAKSFLPSPKAYAHLAQMAVVAPVPKAEILTPAQIKGLITKLASKDILGNLPEGTPNVLLYNNATTLAKK